MNKIFLIIAIVLIVALLAGGGFMLSTNQQYKIHAGQTATAMQGSYNELQFSQQTAQVNIDNLKTLSTQTSLDKDLIYSVKQTSVADVKQLSIDKSTLEAKSADLEGKLTKLKSDYDQLKTNDDKLKKDYDQVSKDYDQLKTNYADALAKNEAFMCKREHPKFDYSSNSSMSEALKQFVGDLMGTTRSAQWKVIWNNVKTSIHDIRASSADGNFSYQFIVFFGDSSEKKGVFWIDVPCWLDLE